MWLLIYFTFAFPGVAGTGHDQASRFLNRLNVHNLRGKSLDLNGTDSVVNCVVQNFLAFVPVNIDFFLLLL